MENMFENSILLFSKDDTLIENIGLDYVPDINVGHLCQCGIDIAGDGFSFMLDYPEQYVETGVDELPFIGGTRLSLLWTDTEQENHTIIETVFAQYDIEDIELTIVIECLHRCMECVLYNSYEGIDYVEQLIPNFWIPDILTLNFVELSGNFNPDDSLFDAMYHEVVNNFHEDEWDIVFSHYNDSTHYFSNSKGKYGYQDFVIQLIENEIWEPYKNMWLWACNAGYTSETNVAVAYEIAKRYGIEVKAASGTVVLLGNLHEENNEKFYTDLSYFVIDLHGTKYEHVNIDILEGWARRVFMWYASRNKMPEDEQWLYFRG